MLAILLLAGIWARSYQINEECEYEQLKAPGSGPYYRIVSANKWGFMNRAGETVVAPRFDEARNFFDGRAAVRAGKLWGYVDAAGRLAIPPQFAEARRFSEGLAAVRVGRLWGYIDSAGRWRIRPSLQLAGDFHESLARAARWDEVICTGGVVYPAASVDNGSIYGFDPSCRWLPCAPRNPRAGFIDQAGKWAIAAAYREVRDFQEGLAAAMPGDAFSGYLDRAGRMIISPSYFVSGGFRDGVAAVNRPGEGWILINREGIPVTTSVYVNMTPVAEGLVTVAQRTDPCPAPTPIDLPDMLVHFYTDVKRILRLEPVPANDCGPWRFGAIDIRGRPVIPHQFDDMSSFSDGVATVRKGNQTWNIDRTGRRLPLPDAELHFRDGLAIHQGNYIDKQGRVVAPFVTRHGR